MPPTLVAAEPGETATEETVEFAARLFSDVAGPTAAQPAKNDAMRMMAAEKAADLLATPFGTVVISELDYKALIFKRFRGAGGCVPQAKFTERVGFQQLVRRPV